jgi:pyruvate formate lyase activating enzyme
MTICNLCPKYCNIKENEYGDCRLRKNSNGKIILDHYGLFSTITVEPIEKKPIFHYKPGSKTLNVGTWGCNLECDYCANYNISQKDIKDKTKYYSVCDLDTLASNKDCPAICFTFNEPTIYKEYIEDLYNITDKDIIIKSNGLMNCTEFISFCKNIDAINIDWKGSVSHYADHIKNKDQAIIAVNNLKQNLYTASKNTHLEISIPIYKGSTYNSLSLFSLDVDKDTPIHLLRVYSTSNYDTESTLMEEIEEIYNNISKRYSHVYIGNVFGENNKRNTYCNYCKKLLIKRYGLHTEIIDKCLEHDNNIIY